MTRSEEEAREIVEELRNQGSERNLAGMARFGINTDRAVGMSIPPLRAMGKLLGRNHDRALALWDTGWHEARLLAVFTDEVKKVTPAQMESWSADFNSWDITDQCCSNLFIRTPFAMEKVHAWAGREEEFVRRAAFAMIASLAVHSRSMADDDFRALFPLIAASADDERNFVKKAVNWSLRQIGKRNLALHRDAVAFAEELAEGASRASRWIASDALRELQKAETIDRIRAKETRRKPAVSSRRTPPR